MAFWAKKRVWVVGASSGIGEALARQLAEKEARVVVSARNAEKLQQLLAGFPENTVEVIPLDLENLELLPKKTLEAWEAFAGLDYVFLNAGISLRDLAIDCKLEVERKIMDVNFWGPVVITKDLLKQRGSDRHLHLVVTSSLSGKYGVPKLSAYASSKHALHGYFDSLRAETFGSGLHIHIAIPGFIKTEIAVAGLRGDGSIAGKMQQSLASGMDPGLCAARILQCVEDGKGEFVIGGLERFTVPLNRVFPGLMRLLIRSNPLQRIKNIQSRVLGR